MATNTDGREEIKPVAPTEQTKWRDPSLVGKYMVDPKTGLAGLFRSPDNGETWVLTDTVYGHVYNQDEVDNIWDNGAGHKVADEIKSATADLPNVRKQADEAVKFAESAIAASKVNSDAIVAQSSAVVEAKSAIDSATAEIQQLTANAASDVAKIEATIGEVQNAVNQAKSANESTVKMVQTELKSASDAMDSVKQHLDEVDTSLNTYAKSAAEQGHDITLIKQKQGQFEADFASAQGNVNQIQADIKGLRQNIKDNQGNIASLLTSADKLQASMTDAEKNISNLLLTASKYEQTFKDQDGRLSKVEQTATEHTSELADAKGNIDKVTQKADNLQLLLSDAQKNIQNIQLDAKGLHDTLIGQGNQLASLNVTLNSLDSKYSGITGDLQSKQTALSTEQQQTKDMLLRKADKSEVDSVKGTVNQVSAEQKTMADQINQKVSSVEYQTLKDKVNGLRIGGRNLAVGTAEPYTMGFGIPDTTWKDGFAYATLPTAGNGVEILPQEPHAFWYALTPGREYTQTIWFQTDATVKDLKAASITWFTSDGHDHQPATIQKIGPNSYKLFCSYKWPGKNNNDVRLFDISELRQAFDLKTGTYLKFGKLKLETGNVSTDYSPNPDDAIASIKKNSTAIDENSKLISLKANQTDVDNIKGTAQQLSARLDVMAGEVKSKVDETRVNNIVDGKGYATTSTVQSLVDQKAGTINESITNLDAKYKDKDGVNLATKTGNVSLSGGYNSNKNIGYISLDAINDLCGKYMTVSVDVEWSGWKSGNQNRVGYELQINYDDGSTEYDGCWLTPTTANGKQRVTATYKIKDQHVQSLGEGNAYIQINCTSAKVSHLKIERGMVATPWTPAPSDNATVTQLQSVTASIDGLQSAVTNYQKDASSKYTQLSDLMQSKVGTADFDNLKRAVDMQTLDSADINNMRTNGHYFVRNLANNPIGGWVYVDVTGNGNDRIRQDVYQDSGLKHKYRRWFGTYWTGWEEGATYTEITQLQDAVNLRVQKGELLSQINLTAGNTLIQSNKIYLDSSSTVFSGKAFIPSAAIVNLDVAKLNAGTINTDRIHIGDDSVYLSVKNSYLRLDGSNTKDKYQLRLTGNDIEFADNDSSNWEYRIQHGIAKYQTDEDGLDFDVYSKRGGANHTVMAVSDAGVMISPSLFFQTDGIDSSNWMGFTRNTVDGNSSVSFHTWDDNNEGFHVDCGARFMNYVYINGYARAQGWLTNSTLSKKTNIRKLDLQTALDKIRQDDQYLYEYKRNVAKGIHDPQASFIIDDIHDVAQYSVPREFIDQSGEYREPNVELAYLVAAFQALDKQVQSQQAEIKKLKEQLNND